MKTLNLVMAIVYTVVYTIMIMAGLAERDTELVVGCILLSGPLVVNWITYRKIKE